MPPTAARPANGMSIESVASHAGQPAHQRQADEKRQEDRRDERREHLPQDRAGERRPRHARGDQRGVRPAPRDDPFGERDEQARGRDRDADRDRRVDQVHRAEVEVAIRFVVAAVDQRLQPRAELGRAGPEDHAREQRRERPAPRPGIGHQAPRGQQRGGPARVPVQDAAGDVREPPGAGDHADDADRAAHERQQPARDVEVGERFVHGEGEQRRQDQQRRPRARGTGADPPDHAERRHRDAPQQQRRHRGREQRKPHDEQRHHPQGRKDVRGQPAPVERDCGRRGRRRARRPRRRSRRRRSRRRRARPPGAASRRRAGSPPAGGRAPGRRADRTGPPAPARAASAEAGRWRRPGAGRPH